ncbi:hypothetical protein BKP45_20605 [Anaerobacillus alkalidiazotrophicus]|uniref:HTH tetR-type domain-containing protein n=1 Tax=Anaerobacillus alkalidiazotrophicus TaxID=472963 RepID=A0A1S2LZU4_9BACI|nr:TetR/AcrR family transcriptional regulator [Anaerobacillus alkalidiazotrophicus]OIJ17958.1 hypothetical protein BKP45_20605 [Anaerobacillus alkalidiazotrophicus]
MGIKDRRKREGVIIRKKIIEAATELFAQAGYENVSMRKIAAKIEYSPPTLYIYFKNKREILFELLKQGYALFYEAIKSTYDQNKDKDFRNKMLETLRSYVKFGDENKEYYKLMFIHNIDETEQVIGRDNDRYRGFEVLVMLVKEGIADGVINRSDPILLSQSIWAGLHGITALLNTFDKFPWVEKERIIDFHLNMIINGVSNKK